MSNLPSETLYWHTRSNGRFRKHTLAKSVVTASTYTKKCELAELETKTTGGSGPRGSDFSGMVHDDAGSTPEMHNPALAPD